MVCGINETWHGYRGFQRWEACLDLGQEVDFTHPLTLVIQ